MFFCLTFVALTLFSGKEHRFNNSLTMNYFGLWCAFSSKKNEFFFIKSRKKFAQTKK